MLTSCIHCGSSRVARLTGARAVEVTIYLGDSDTPYCGEVPGDMGIGEGDYVEFAWCLDCLGIQVEGPLRKCAIEPRRPRKAPVGPGPRPELVTMAAQWPGRCGCGASFKSGAVIAYSRVIAEVVKCPVCVDGSVKGAASR